MKKHMHKNISMLLLVLVSILFVLVGCSDMMAMAALAEKSYTVTFDSQDATTDVDLTSKTVTSPATTIDGLPTAPEKTGYIFGGWFTEGAGGGSEFTASTEVPGDITVYAKWTADTYTVTFDSQAATTAADPTSKTVTSPATTIEGLPTAPEKTGYTFGGWFTEEAGGGSEFTASTEVPGDMTVYAKWRAYTVGGMGPAGGYVFYDKGIFSDGWRYLEAAPSDIMLGESDYHHMFGYYRTTPTGGNTLVGTGTGIGTGKPNTAALVGAMLEAAYTSEFSNTTTGEYAARLCNIHKVGEYEDWFLPSMHELNLMYENLHSQGIGGFYAGSYWSSSEVSTRSARLQFFGDGDQISYDRDGEIRVRPVRAF